MRIVIVYIKMHSINNPNFLLWWKSKYLIMVKTNAVPTSIKNQWNIYPSFCRGIILAQSRPQPIIAVIQCFVHFPDVEGKRVKPYIARNPFLRWTILNHLSITKNDWIDLLEDFYMAGIRLVLHHHLLKIITFSEKENQWNISLFNNILIII